MTGECFNVDPGVNQREGTTERVCSELVDESKAAFCL